jgi:hypothetical protein
MLFGNANIKTPAREFLREQVKPRAGWHGGIDGDDALIRFSLRDQRIGEDLGEGRRSRRCLGLFAGDDIELHHAVIFVGRGFRRRIALALLRHHMQQDRALVIRIAQIAQNGQQMVQIMPIHGADIIEAKLFKQSAAGQQPARIFIGPRAARSKGAGKRLASRAIISRSERKGRDEIAWTDKHSSHQQAARWTCHYRSRMTMRFALDAPALFMAS